MKQKSDNQKTTQRNSQGLDQSPSAGSNGIAIVPPTYGIGSIDYGLSESQASSAAVAQRQADVADTGGDARVRSENRTGLPDNLKIGIESLSGLALDNVRVHYNSDKPAQLNALAYTQGTEIHVAPGQEKYLPHEAWHVVQQAQGRVQPTMQMKGVAINDGEGLEHEADVMGAQATVVGHLAVPSRLFQGRAEPAEAHPQREPISGQGEKGPLNFLSSTQTWRGKNVGNNQVIQRVEVKEGEWITRENNELVEFPGMGGCCAVMITIFNNDGQPVLFGALHSDGKEETSYRATDMANTIKLNKGSKMFTVLKEMHFSSVEKNRDDHYRVMKQFDEILEEWASAVIKKSLTYEHEPNENKNITLKWPNEIPQKHPVAVEEMEELPIRSQKGSLPQGPSKRLTKQKGPKVPTRKRKTKLGSLGCFITSACMEYRGLGDDCEELTTLRQFRDTYLMQKPNGQELINLYYKYSPGIVVAIHEQEDEEEILEGLYQIIRQCVAAIKAENNEWAYQTYCKMVLQLKDRFIPEVQTPPISY